jgi:hypothetical protein
MAEEARGTGVVLDDAEFELLTGPGWADEVTARYHRARNLRRFTAAAGVILVLTALAFLVVLTGNQTAFYTLTIVSAVFYAIARIGIWEYHRENHQREN